MGDTSTLAVSNSVELHGDLLMGHTSTVKVTAPFTTGESYRLNVSSLASLIVQQPASFQGDVNLGPQSTLEVRI
jgi:hypothetical protein